MTEDFFKRCGRFSVNRYMLSTHTDEMLNHVFNRMVIIRAECMFHNDTIDYMAYSEDFAVCPSGTEPPLYQALFTRHPDGAITIAWAPT